jgi:hypothetical protein
MENEPGREREGRYVRACAQLRKTRHGELDLRG